LEEKLGCVTEVSEAEIDHDSGEMDEAHPAAPCFVTTQRDPNIVLQTREDVLDTIAHSEAKQPVIPIEASR
jgi:hypothetical protein